MAKRIRKKIIIGKNESGEPTYQWITGSSDQELFEKAAALLADQTKAMTPVSVTLKEYAQKWKRLYKDGKVRHNTLQGYEGYLQNHIIPYFGDWDIRKIKVDDVQEFLNTMGDRLSRKTIDEIKRTLAMVLDAARDSGLIQHNPAKSKCIRNPSSKKSVREPLTSEQAKAIMQALPSLSQLRDRRLLAMLLYLPVRMEDIMGLQIKDIDPKAMEIHIRQGVTFDVHSRPVVDLPKTSAGIRTMLILPALWEALELSDEELTDSERYVLHHRNSVYQPYTLTTKQRAWQRITSQIDVFGKTPHCFRHTFATMAYRAGVPEKTIQSMGGWKDLATMRNIYIHTQKEDLEAARRILTQIDGKIDTQTSQQTLTP